jgi:hypothetical protein
VAFWGGDDVLRQAGSAPSTSSASTPLGAEEALSRGGRHVAQALQNQVVDVIEVKP